MLAARLLVCEQSGDWAVALRRELQRAGAEARVFETRTLAELLDELAASPHSFAVVELRLPIAKRLLEWLLAVEREYPGVAVAVVGDRLLAEYRGVFREAGAVEFVVSPRRLAPLVRMAQRQLALAPREVLNWQEEIWSRLPWGAAG
jgi:hypothetical protein